MLQELAQVLQGGVRSCDILARYGGEEFAIIMPECAGEVCAKAGERLRKAVAAQSIVPTGKEDAPPVKVTVSVGVACMPDIAAKNVEDLVEHADGALYRAKAEGRNRTVVAPPSKGGKKS